MLLVLPRMLRKPALGDHTHALRETTGAMLGQITPHRAAEEQRVPVDPLLRLPVERARSGRDREPRTLLPFFVDLNSGSAVRLPTTVMIVSPAIRAYLSRRES